MFRHLVLVSIVAVGLAACQDGAGQKEAVGTLLGGVGGAVAGAQFGKGDGRVAASAAGALLGALLGNQVGRSLDRADELALRQSFATALEKSKAGTSVEWNNPDSGNYGTVTPERTYKTETGQYCREFSQTIVIGGQSQDAFGTACRQPDGSWKIAQ